MCDNRRALCRTLAGVWCLTYSSPSFPRESYNGNILEWGGRFARNAIDELDARCGDGDAFARTQWGPIVDNWTRLFLNFFYGQGVSRRAGTLLHEARHADGRGHDRGNNDSSWAYNGAWRWHVCWLGLVLVAEGRNSSAAMKAQARQRANNILNNNFAVHPGFNI